MQRKELEVVLDKYKKENPKGSYYDYEYIIKSSDFFDICDNIEKLYSAKIDEAKATYYDFQKLREENTILKAKQEVYESIIANSNFAPMLKKKKEDK